MRKLHKKPKGKGKRWPKGHSSSSNPETKKFRDAAKSRFFRHEVGHNSALTVGALKTLDAFNSQKYPAKESVESELFDDTSSVDSWTSFKSFKTFASEWSECSNASFSRLINNFQPNSFLHKEMLAVLAAVTEVIKSNGGKETSTEYFGALITTLGVTEDEDSVAAILSVLSMGIKSVPNEVLRLKFGETSKVFLDLLAKYSEVENAVILRAVIGCLSVTLRAQDPGVWAQPSTQEIFHSILVFSTHSKPKVRKAGQHAVCAILKASAMFTPEDTHPGALTAAKYCIHQIQNSADLGGNTTILHVLTLLKEIIGSFPRTYIKNTCEILLKLMMLGTALVTISSLEVLHGLFVSSPPASRFDATLNAQILNALYDYQPSVNDSQATVAWLTVMQEAYKTLAKNDPRLCGENLSKFFVRATNLWLSDNLDIRKGCTVSLRAVALDCIKACSSCVNYPQICRNIFDIVENCLKYQYNMAWVQVFNVLGVLFEVIGKDGEDYMINCLRNLGDFRESRNFLYVSELDYTIGRAIRMLGPETVLKAIPIIITGKEVNCEFRTTWLLPILKDNIQTSTLKFFIDYFLPMASICERKSKELNAKDEKIGAHSYDLLQIQIWSLLSPICNNATDVKESFKAIAKILGDIISTRKYLRLPAMAALRKLITRNKERNNKENIDELSKFSKNYLPIFFNLYITKPEGTDEAGERLAAYDTIKVYLTITGSHQRGELYDRALKRLDETDKSDTFRRDSLMDLVKLLLPYQNKEKLEISYKMCLKALKKTKSKRDEKKFYRLLEVIISSKSENCKTFTKSKRNEIISFLLKSIKNPKCLNRGARLRCIFHMVRVLPKNQFGIIKAFIPEVVISCKDINKKTREFAFRLLEEMFQISRTWSEKSNDDAIKDYISVIMGGLAGSHTLICATILALCKLTHALRNEMPSDVAQTILENIELLSCLPEREIVGCTLEYLKVFIVSFPKDQVLVHVPTLVNAVVSMADDCKNHFRTKVRDVLDRLLRKFGYELIQPLIPEGDVVLHRRLKNLKKINDKKKTNKSEKEKEYDVETEEFAPLGQPKSIDEILARSDESDEDSEPKGKRRKHKNKSETFIQEDVDNIVDFISPSASSRISAAKPAEKKKKKTESDFKYTADGRMIIAEDDDASGSESHDENDDSDLDGLTSKLDSVLIGRKRKISTDSGVPAKYQAGGSGIHRPIPVQTDDISSKLANKKKKTEKKNEVPSLKTGQEYKAKKAKGDVKLKGKPDPYAYIPLSRKMLNRRKEVQNFIKSAIKAAKMGNTLKMKRRK